MFDIGYLLNLSRKCGGFRGERHDLRARLVHLQLDFTGFDLKHTGNLQVVVALCAQCGDLPLLLRQLAGEFLKRQHIFIGRRYGVQQIRV